MSRMKDRRRCWTSSLDILPILFENRERTDERVGRVLDVVHRGDCGARRTFFQRPSQRINRIVGPFRGNLYAAISAVADPPCDVQTPSFLAHEPSESYTLHPAADDNVAAHHFPLSAFQPWAPTRGTKRTGAISGASTLPPIRRATTSFLSSLSPTGTMRRPPSASGSINGCCKPGAAAPTRIASYGAYSRQPTDPSPRSSDTLRTPERWIASRAC